MAPSPTQQWDVHVQVLDPLPGQPHPRRVACETVLPEQPYRHRGRDRSGEHYLFKYSLAGRGRFIDATGAHPVPVGHAFLTPIADPTMVYDHPPEERRPWHFVYCAFVADAALVEALRAARGPVVPLSPSAPLIRRLLAFRDHASTGRDMTSGEAMRFVAELLAELSDGRAPRPGAGAELVERARAQIERRLESAPDVAGLARELGVGRAWLARAFRRHLGRSPQRYLLERRMRHAAALLRDPGANDSVSAIARRLGFDTASHFARAFRREYGISPGALLRGEALPPL